MILGTWIVLLKEKWLEVIFEELSPLDILRARCKEGRLLV